MFAWRCLNVGLWTQSPVRGSLTGANARATCANPASRAGFQTPVERRSDGFICPVSGCAGAKRVGGAPPALRTVWL